MGITSIQWTDRSWNPITGCSKVSQGCKHCYAETMANRMWATQYSRNSDGTPRRFTDVRCHPDRLAQPLSWRKPQRVFVNSMSDLFHEDVPDAFICEVFTIMRQASEHIFQVLTKRPERMQDFVTRLAWRASLPGERGYHAYLGESGSQPLPNVWLGVSVEDRMAADERVPLLLQAPAAVHFLSCEPLLGPVDIVGLLNPGRCDCEVCRTTSTRCTASRHPLDWVIVGGESGKMARTFDMGWARDILSQCRAAGVACFIKQMGAHAIKIVDEPGSLLHGERLRVHFNDSHGGDMAEWPADLQVREFPSGAVPA